MKLSDIIDLVTAIAVIFAAIQIYINRKQLYLSTITKCIEDFRKLDGLNRETTDHKTLTKYIDISSEELFYFKHDYLPKKVAIEWIDGMIDFIPITRENVIINSSYCISELSNNFAVYFSNFPRLRNAFKIQGHFDIELIYNKTTPDQDRRMKERRRLINEIIKNNNNFKYFD